MQLDFPSLAFPPDRKVLYVSEVASRLDVTDQHVMDLIDEGKLQAINVGGHTRKFWRIPVEAYLHFLQQNHSYVLPLEPSPKSALGLFPT
jgi:excisionase family DNA binding protein